MNPPMPMPMPPAMRSIASVTAVAALLASAPHRSANAFDPDLFAGDIGQILIPAVALGMTWHFDDPEGRMQWAKSVGTTFVTSQVLKRGFASTSLGTRPNGGSQSFPSGHTSAACSGGFFMAHRYGWEYGAPWLAFAAFTAYSRVDEEMHHWRDVVAGCALAYGVSRWFVSEQQSKLSVSLSVGPGYRGIALSYRF